MPNTNEQRLDIIVNCNILLKKIAGYDSTDNTAEGRMIAQLTWLKERAEDHDLPLPVKPEMLGTLSYIYTDGTLSFHASEPNDREVIYRELGFHMGNLLRLAKYDELLLKQEYIKFIPPCIDALLFRLNHSHRRLIDNELKFCKDLKIIKKLVVEGKIQIPQRSCMPQFKSFIDAEYSVADIKGAQTIYYIIEDLIFRGVRPNTWLTPEDAEIEVKSYFSL